MTAVPMGISGEMMAAVSTRSGAKMMMDVRMGSFGEWRRR
jgi:hypothetical protein